MKKPFICFLLCSIILMGCHYPTTSNALIPDGKDAIETKPPKSIKKTEPSTLENNYINFNSPSAINRLAAIENEYFEDSPSSVSRFYGTVWGDQASVSPENQDEISLFDQYQMDLASKNKIPHPLDCTLYAMEGLQAGLGNDFSDVNKSHQRHWNDREYAGWSIGYILVEEYDWKAYLFISETSKEYDACLRNFEKDKKYHVWKQPDIAIEKIFDFDKDQSSIDSLLTQHEFGWGFSEQGWHTWITRFNELKECNWLGSPSDNYQNGFNIPLFKKTKFIEYHDYASHIIIFPVKKTTFQSL